MTWCHLFAAFDMAPPLHHNTSQVFSSSPQLTYCHLVTSIAMPSGLLHTTPQATDADRTLVIAGCCESIHAHFLPSSWAGKLSEGWPIVVLSFVTNTLPGGAPLGFFMSVGDAVMTGHLPSPLPLEYQAAMSAAYCTSASEASLANQTKTIVSLCMTGCTAGQLHMA